jgi:copper transport protein
MLSDVRWVWRCIVSLLVIALPATASAHTSLRSSEPASGARLANSPARIVLWFTARPQLAFSSLRVTGPHGEIVLGKLLADTGDALRADIPAPLPTGTYRVEWQSASADGHPVRGEYSFLVAPPGDTTVIAPAAPASTAPPHMENRGARWLEFVGLLMVLGALGFRHAVLPPLASRGVSTTEAADRATRFCQSALVLYLFAVAVRLYGESSAVHGMDRALEPGALREMLTSTAWGAGWISGVIGALLLLVSRPIAKRSAALATPIELTGALGMVLAPAMSGHAVAASHFIVSVTLDAAHVAAAGLWLGGLLMVLLAGIPAMRRVTDGNPDAAVGALVTSFHPLALLCAPVVVLAGLGSSWIRLGTIDALATTDYGNALLIKLALFVVVAGMATYNALRGRRRLGAVQGTRHFRMSASIEVLFAAMVLWATTLLVSTPMPSEMVR